MPIRVEPHAEPIPGYRLIERLGGGGFGEVWKAEVPGGLFKAIKFLYGDVQTMGEESQRADQEFKALQRVKNVRHPFILSLEQFQIVEGRLMIVMELADRNLWDRYRECRNQGLSGMPREELLRYMEETAEALDYMNLDNQLQHLDIKPQNLFLVHNHVKVADFGLVKDLQGAAATITGGVTPVYAAPETFDGWLSRYCDQYSLAIVYQELLTGQRPFVGNNVHQLVLQHVQGQPNLEPLPKEDRAAIGRALAKNPDERFPSCRDLMRALRRPQAPEPSKTSEFIPRREGRPSERPDPVLAEAAEPVTTSSNLSSYLDCPILPSDPSSGPLHQAGKSIPPPLLRDAATRDISLHPVSSEIFQKGQLFPALVVGLGQVGLATLRQLRRELADRYGSPDALPCVRWLYLDTDPEALARATDGGGRGGLNRADVLVAKLNRASYYLNPRQGRPRIDTWFDPTMLYRIQRTQVTGGVRALGRLAFFGNYRSIAGRLRTLLNACLDPEALNLACQQTGLSPYSDALRVYVVANLAGGTGSGMFIDLAYVLRDQLKQMGHPHAQVIGLLTLPAADAKLTRTMALGNVYAALTELNHFSSPEISFSARYDERDKPVANSQPPFERCVFVTAPPESGGQAAEVLKASEVRSSRLCGEYLCQELTAPLGRLADEFRAAATAQPLSTGSLVCQSFGLFRYTWPRQAMRQWASRSYGRQLVQRWISKEIKPLQEKVRTWVQEAWDRHELGAESLIRNFREACAKALGKEPESAIAAVLDPILVPAQKKGAELNKDALLEALAELKQLIGHPTDSSVMQTLSVLDEPLRTTGETLTRQWQDQISTFTVDLLDQPQFRLAGAEEAVRQGMRLIEGILTHHEPLCQELAEKAAKSWERLQFLVSNVAEFARGGRRGTQLAAELIELLRLYPKWRYQGLVLRRVIFTFTSLRGFLSDQIREIGFYRLRLGELLSVMTAVPVEEAGGQATCDNLYPVGCADLDEAVKHLVPEASPAEVEELDRRLQDLIQQQFGSLKQVCSTSAYALKALEALMLTEAEAYVGARLGGTDVATTYFSHHTTPESALKGIVRAFGNAVSDLLGRGARAFLAVPAGQEDRFRPLADQALPNVHIVAGLQGDELVFYREGTQFTLADLPHVGPAGEDAYYQMTAAEHFTPHTRSDITDWREVVVE